MLDDFSAFMSRHASLEPEEATSLGICGHEGRLRDMSEAGESARDALWDDAVVELTSGDEAGQDPEALLDRRTLRRHALFERHIRRDFRQQANPQWALYPYIMTRYLAAARRADVQELTGADAPYGSRAAAVPGFLTGHQEQLLAAREAGVVAHRSFLTSLCERELTAAADYFAEINVSAARAIEDHIGFLRRELLDAAPELQILGEEECAERLRLLYGIDRPLDELVSEAQLALTETHATMIRVASALRPGAGIRSFSDVAALMSEYQAEVLLPDCDLDAHYRGIIQRAVDHLGSCGEFHAVDVEALGMDRYPEGMRDQGPGTNWPAPLLNPEARGQFVLHPDPAAHSRAWSVILAVHEGIPGHFLQSLGFQKHFAKGRTPVRFLAVADDVAIPRLNFCSMLNLEGYAVYAEECVRRSGFHEGPDELFALAAHALRAVRVIGEIQFHRGLHDREKTEAFIMENAGLPSAFWEVERYQRGPLQAVAYFFGAAEFWKLREGAETKEGAAFSPAAFHERLFSFGPALPADIADLS